MNLERAILTVLNRYVGESGPLAARESVVVADVNMELPNGVTLTPLREGLQALESKRQIVSVQDEDRGTLWKITALGRARLAE